MATQFCDWCEKWRKDTWVDEDSGRVICRKCSERRESIIHSDRKEQLGRAEINKIGDSKRIIPQQDLSVSTEDLQQRIINSLTAFPLTRDQLLRINEIVNE